jgi:hypothetical protein
MGTYEEDLKQRWQEFRGAEGGAGKVEQAADLVGELGKGAVAVTGVGVGTAGGLMIGVGVGIAVTAGIAAAPVAIPVAAGCALLGAETGFFASDSAVNRYYFNAETDDRRKIERTVGKVYKLYGYIRGGRKGLGWLARQGTDK